MADRSVGRWAGPALALLSLTLVAGGAELVLRAREARRVERILARDPTRELCTEPDPELLYRYASGRCGFNARGYRDREHALAKPPGVFRFAVIGDSVAAGDGVELDERFDRVLERRLAQSGERAEAINLARTGYSTAQELIVFEKEAFAYHPDLVIWSYVLNDPADPIYHNANGRLGRFYERPRSYAWHELSRVVFKVRERFAARGCPEEFHLLLHCVYAERVSAALARIGALSASQHTPVLFVIHPVFQREPARDESAFAALHAELAREAHSSGLAVVDLREAYARAAPGELQQTGDGWFDPWHPNARGHAVAAEAIEAALRQ